MSTPEVQPLAAAEGGPLPSRWPMARRTALLLLAVCTLLRVVSLLRPCLSDDEATYAVVGREMLHGQTLYRDVVDHKPPAIYLVNEATQALGGPVGGMVLLHALLILVVWGTGLMLASLVRQGGGDPRGPPIAALLWIVFTTTLIDTDSLAANCELFMMGPLVASVVVFAGARGRVAHVLAAGALVGVGMWFKYQAGIQLPLYGLAWLVTHRRAPLRAIAGVVALAVGVAAALAAIIGWLWWQGAAESAWFWFRFNFAYIDVGMGKSTLPQAIERVAFVAVAAAPLYLWAIGGARRQRPARWFLFGWTAASVAAVVVGSRFFGHYFHQITAPAAVLAAPAALAWFDRHRRWFVAALAVPATIFFGLAVAHDALMAAAGEPDPDYASVSAWLDAHGQPSDGLCVWGNSPVLYFEANRPLGCRFVFANYLTGLSPATPNQTDPTVDSSRNIVPEAWDELELDLAARQPRFLVDGSPGNVAYYGRYAPAKFPRLQRILDCAYEPAALVAGMQIYTRRAAPHCR